MDCPDFESCAAAVPRQPGPQRIDGDQWLFRVWAPAVEALSLNLINPHSESIPMTPEPGGPDGSGRGWWRVQVNGLVHGQRYGYEMGRHTRPDPASPWQPDGVHWPSAVVDHESFSWACTDFVPPPLDELLVYELHVGAFTSGATFDSALARLDHVAALGVNAVEVMPVAQNPGERNWGYDGVALYAVQHSYGGPDAFKRFVDGCHQRGLAVILDVVYNHLGPEGNYLREFGPYFTSRVRTPWGEALNFDGPGSDAVRDFFIANALYWFEHYRVDGLRLDAVHAIHDERPMHFLTELSAVVDEYAKGKDFKPLLIAETHANDPWLVTPRGCGGFGMDSAWSDDFHHSLHALLTGEDLGYYADYGSFGDLVRAVAEGFVFQGEHSVWRGRSHGLSAAHLPGETFTIFAQNHDMVGNRAGSERLAALTSWDALFPAAALLLLSPYTPLLFMGEEWGETRPFNYFVDHGDEKLVRAVRFGRRQEFSRFGWSTQPPPPESSKTFTGSRLDWSKLEDEDHAGVLQWYTDCIRLRKEHPALRGCDRSSLVVHTPERAEGTGVDALVLERAGGGARCAVVCSFSPDPVTLDVAALTGRSEWRPLLLSPSMGEAAVAPAQLALPGYGCVVFEGE